MQTPTLFADLRQPTSRPSFIGLNCLRDLNRPHIEWLAGQDGFAGEIHCDGRFFEWRREIDLQPPAAYPDAGSLRFDGDIMVEEGREVPYVEHWHRAVRGAEPGAGFRLREVSTGCRSIVVRRGDLFMYARARPGRSLAGGRLIDWVDRTSDLTLAQDLVDCEISYGRIESGGWLIERSSLPYRENQWLGLSACESGPGKIRTADVAPTGGFLCRSWEITNAQGTVGDVLQGP